MPPMQIKNDGVFTVIPDESNDDDQEDIANGNAEEHDKEVLEEALRMVQANKAEE